MSRGQAVLAGLGVVLVGAGVVLAIVDLGAADQVASVASFLLAAVLGGIALADRRLRHRDDDPPAASPPEPASGNGSPANSPAFVAGPGSRVAYNSEMVINGDNADATVTINKGVARRPWWWFWG